tara:strand:+ start:1546 stop:2253 length:708 start_codon:yes stop_codon:yes gene_type:complete
MPTADSFTALGRGNGFPFCLSHINLANNETILNAPDLEETMKAYWNISKLSFGGAVFEPTNEPKDLICNPDDNQGTDVFEPSPHEYDGEFFECTLSSPFKVKDIGNDKSYYAHGIQFAYNVFDVRQFGGDYSPTGADTTTIYTSTKIRDYSSPYECENFYYSTSPGTPPSKAGKIARQTDQTTSSVTIGGIPFIKTIIQSWDEIAFDEPDAPASCPSADFINPTTVLPSIAFHTY